MNLISKEVFGEFEDIIQKIINNTEKNGFKVLYIHDVKETLSKKDFEISNYKIIEICNAKFAYEILSKNPELGAFLPCRIAVFQKNNGIIIKSMSPTAIKDSYPNLDLHNIPEQVEEIIENIISEI